MIAALSSSLRNFLCVALMLPLAACGDNITQPGPGGLSPEDASLLDKAAEKLDAGALPPPMPLQTAGTPMPSQTDNPTSKTIPKSTPAPK